MSSIYAQFEPARLLEAVLSLSRENPGMLHCAQELILSAQRDGVHMKEALSGAEITCEIAQHLNRSCDLLLGQSETPPVELMAQFAHVSVDHAVTMFWLGALIGTQVAESSGITYRVVTEDDDLKSMQAAGGVQ